ncbi:hypothetical protein [Dyella sp. OK004]|uniref:hypothetical protein n=1 Tax=Dyella sp. OK004 TaxID=1855292 RepID=UPI001160C816|nr:hypothetical protein [Dyella sp. OK004]
MSDFLDRLAARAIGSDSVLTPRLPSLFEPMQRVAVMPPVQGVQVERDRLPVGDEVTETPPMPTSRSRAADAVDPVEARRAPLSVREQMAPPAQHERVAFKEASPSVAPQTARPAEATQLHTTIIRHTEHDVVSRDAVRPRQTRLEPASTPPMERSREDQGVLLPPAAPVFATPVATAAPARRPESSRSAAASSGLPHSETGETTVHVSIGRLEVRAAPAAMTAATPRRQDAARPSSLDEYLRERGKQTS